MVRICDVLTYYLVSQFQAAFASIELRPLGKRMVLTGCMQQATKRVGAVWVRSLVPPTIHVRGIDTR